VSSTGARELGRALVILAFVSCDALVWPVAGASNHSAATVWGNSSPSTRRSPAGASATPRVGQPSCARGGPRQRIRRAQS